MKISRYISVLATACVLGFASSCDITGIDNESIKKYGIGDAVVGFASDTYTFKESAGIVSIPLQITGSPKVYPFTFDITTGNVVSDVELKDLVYFTQTEGFQFNGALPDGKETPANVFVEFKITDDLIINENRSFEISLANVEGAELGEITTATIIIKDNDNNPYEKLWGDWVCTCVNNSSAGGSASWPVNLSGGFTREEEDANADKVLVAWGFGGQKEDVSMYSNVDPLKQPAWYINIDVENFSVSIQTGTRMADIWSFNGIDEDCVVKVETAAPGGSVSNKYEIPGTISSDLNTITFESDAVISAIVYGVSGTRYGTWMSFKSLVLTRK